MKIRFITTGGTIDKIYFDARNNYEVGDSPVQEILAESHATIDFDILSLLRKDSLDLTDDDRKLIRETIVQSRQKHIVVTHGTDTMIETAKVLLGIPQKVIVLTGSLNPARFRQSDAVFNVGAAVAAVQCLPAGVYIAMGGRIFTPDRVRKNRERNRFEEVEPEGASRGGTHDAAGEARP
jgi:L-asparaginase